MRACTAVVTEISYNYTDSNIRAEVEFLTPAEWRAELIILRFVFYFSSDNITYGADSGITEETFWMTMETYVESLMRTLKRSSLSLHVPVMQ